MGRRGEWRCGPAELRGTVWRMASRRVQRGMVLMSIEVEILDAAPKDPSDLMAFPRCLLAYEELPSSDVKVGMCHRRSDHDRTDEWHWSVFAPSGSEPTYVRWRERVDGAA